MIDLQALTKGAVLIAIVIAAIWHFWLAELLLPIPGDVWSLAFWTWIGWTIWHIALKATGD